MGALEPALVFTGFMGAGKSSAARAVAADLRVQAFDSDHELERELGEPIESWFESFGQGFHYQLTGKAPPVPAGAAR